MLHPTLNSGSARIMADVAQRIQERCAAAARDPAPHPYRIEMAGLSGDAAALWNWIDAVRDCLETGEAEARRQRALAIGAETRASLETMRAMFAEIVT